MVDGGTIRIGLVMARNADPMSQAFAVAWAYFPTISNGVLNPTDSVLQEIERFCELLSDPVMTLR